MTIELLTSPIPWAIGFLALMVLELSTAGFVAGFMAFGSLLTALIVQFGLVDTPGGAVFAFLASTIVSAIALWKPVSNWAGGRTTSDEEEGIVPFVGDVATVEGDALSAVGGTIRIHGARMRAVLTFDAGMASLPAGEQVRVIGRDPQQRFIVVPQSKEVEEQVQARVEIAEFEKEARRQRKRQPQ